MANKILRIKTIVALSIIFITELVFLTVVHQPKVTLAPMGTFIPTSTGVKPTSSPAPSVTLLAPSQSKILQNDYHIFQTFNNCGPASLSMTLSYYGISVSQQELGQALRPYQNPQGDNDDKSVTLGEIAEKAKEYNLIPYHRPNGSIQLIKQFITYDIPLLTRTWLKENEDIGHYRVVKGYDDTTNQLVQDDSLQGKNLRYTYDSFNRLWQKFNYEYVVLIPEDKKHIAEAILGQEADEVFSWRKARDNALAQLQQNPNDRDARFNLSVAYYYTGEHQKSVEEYEKVERELPIRTLWYQIEPILSYYEVKNFSKVFSITDNILNNHNRAYSEAYIVRGKAYQELGNPSLAREEFQKALFYNRNLREAQELLNN